MARVKTGIFLILWILVIVTGVILGRWQLDRLAWKTAWIGRIADAYSQSFDLNKYKYSTLPCTSIDRTFFTRTSGVITYDQGISSTFIVQPRVVDGMFGRYVFTRATFANDTKMWINRGFVPNDIQIPPPPKTEHVTFQIRGTDMGVSTILSDNPELTFDELRARPSCEPLAVIGVIEESEIKSPWPQPVGTRPHPPNDHLFYAFFWFTMSAIAAIMGGIVFINTRQSSRNL